MDPDDTIPPVTRRRYLQACLDGDFDAALDLCRQLLRSGVGVPVIVGSLLAPAQWQVGDLWLHGYITVAQEHLVTAVSEAVVQALVAEWDVPRADARLLITGPEGEWHVLPGRMVTLVLRQLGWDVFGLTPSLPADDLAVLAREEHGHVAGISCSLAAHLVPAWQSISALRQAGFRIVAGGRAFDADPEVAQLLGADAHIRDPLEAHVQLLEWVGLPPPEPRPPTLGHRWSQLDSTWRATARVVQDAAVVAVDAEGVALARDVLRQDLSLILRTAVAAALVDRESLLSAHMLWYHDLLEAAEIDRSVSAALLRSIGRVLPADAGAVRDVIAAVGHATTS